MLENNPENRINPEYAEAQKRAAELLEHQQATAEQSAAQRLNLGPSDRLTREAGRVIPESKPVADEVHTEIPGMELPAEIPPHERAKTLSQIISAIISSEKTPTGKRITEAGGAHELNRILEQ